MGKYDDIINLKRPASKHPKMSLYQRSAQFAPYSALTGYEGQVKETARLTDRRIELDEELKVILDSIQSDIIYVDIMDANYSYAGDILMYARLTDKYLSIEINRDSILTVSDEPSPFYNKNVDALISYVSLYTDKPVKANYPEK